MGLVCFAPLTTSITNHIKFPSGTSETRGSRGSSERRIQLEIAFVLRAFDSSGVEVQEEEGGKKESSSEKMNQRTDDERSGLPKE